MTHSGRDSDMKSESLIGFEFTATHAQPSLWIPASVCSASFGHAHGLLHFECTLLHIF